MLSIKNIKLIEVENKNTQHILYDDFSIDIFKQEFIGVTGKNKYIISALFKSIAGIFPLALGSIILGRSKIADINTSIGYIDSEPCLFDWLTVSEHLHIILDNKEYSKKKSSTVKDHILTLFGAHNLEKKYPTQLSKVEKIKVALMQNFLLGVKVLLIDNTFSQIVETDRIYLQDLLLKAWREYQPTILFRGDDLEELMYLADRVIWIEGQPAEIKNEFIIPFNRPRKKTLLQKKEFYEYKITMLNKLRK